MAGLFIFNDKNQTNFEISENNQFSELFIWLSRLTNQPKQYKKILDKSDHASKKGDNSKPGFSRCESRDVAFDNDASNPYNDYGYNN